MTRRFRSSTPRTAALTTTLIAQAAAMALGWASAPQASANNALPLSTSPGVPAQAADAVLGNYGVFVEPLVADAPYTKADRAALEAAVHAYATHATQAGTPDALADFGALKDYLQAPSAPSPWRVALLVNMGLRSEQLGYAGQALDFYARAADAAAATPGPRLLAAQGQLDGVLADRVLLSARLGHLAQVRALLADPRMAALTGSSQVRANFARLALEQMERDPEHAMRCGWVALEALMRARGASGEQLLDLATHLAGVDGSSLADLARWARGAGVDLQPLHREAGTPVPVPSVAHMKTGHFAAILAQRGEGAAHQFHVADAVLGQDRWIGARAIEEETSGDFLARPDESVRLVALDDAQASAIRGAGNPNNYDHNATSPNGNKTGGDTGSADPGASGLDGNGQTDGSGPVDQSPDGSACPCTPADGMPRYAVQSLNLGLTIFDTPLRYTPPAGPEIAFAVYYSQNEANQPATIPFSNLGPKWTHNWLAYVTDDPSTPGAQVAVYKRGGGAQVYAGFNAANGTFARAPRREQLVLVSSNPITYERRFADGSKEVYGQSDGSAAYPRRIFLTRLVDAAGNAAKLTYDTANRLSKITDAVGFGTLTLGYNGTSKLIASVTDSFGRPAVNFGYTAGALTSLNDTLPMSSSFAWTNGVITSMTTPYGTTTFKSNVVSNFKRWIEITDPLSFTERTEYESNGANGLVAPASTPAGMDVVTADLNYRNTFYWDKQAYPGAKNADGTFDFAKATTVKHFAETNPGNAITAPVVLATKTSTSDWEWYLFPDMTGADGTYSGKTVTDWWALNATGRVLPNGSSRVSRVTYNDLGKILTRTDPLKRLTTYTYDTNGIDLLTVTQTDRAGTTTETIYKASNYNALHEPQTVVDAAGQTTTYTYTPLGQIFTRTDALHHLTTWHYNALHQLYSITDTNNATVAKFTYDALDRVRTSTDAGGYVKTFDYDNLNRGTQVTYPDGTFDLTGYDKLDVHTVTDRLTHTSTLLHDADRRLYQATDPYNIVTTYGYDNMGRLTSFTDGNQHTTRWILDTDGRLQTKQYPSGEGYTLTYDGAGREKTRTDSLNQVRTYAYNDDGTLRGVSYTAANTPAQNYVYDPLYPRLTQITDGTSKEVTTFAYAPAGTLGAGKLKLETSTAANAQPVGYTYDELGRPSTRSVGNYNETWTYDAIGRLHQDTNALGSFLYDYLGETTQPKDENLVGAQWATQWNWGTNLQDRMLQSITHTPPATKRASPGLLQQVFQGAGWSSAPQARARPFTAATGITYGTQTGQIATRTQGVDSWKYGYDADNRLQSAAYTGTGTGQGAQFKNDAADNLTQIVTTSPASTTNFVPNLDNQVASVNGARTVTYGYDLNGNVVDDGISIYTWDAENRLITIKRKSDSHLSTFAYDGLGRRETLKDQAAGGPTNTVRLTYCNGSPTPCASGLGGNVTAYLAQGEASSTANVFYARDHQGSVMQVVDSTGKVLGSRQYTPYGVAYAVTGTLPGLGYAGMFQHGPTGLYLTPHRVYSAGDGRWLSRDPAEEAGGSNVYAYVTGNPIARVDEMGLLGSDDSQFDSYSQSVQGALTTRQACTVAAVALGMTTAGVSALAESAIAGAVTVTSWAGEGIVPDLAAGRWVMTGNATVGNYVNTGLWGPQYSAEAGFYLNKVPFANSITGEIEASSLSWPSGWQWLKGIVGQRVIKP